MTTLRKYFCQKCKKKSLRIRKKNQKTERKIFSSKCFCHILECCFENSGETLWSKLRETFAQIWRKSRNFCRIPVKNFFWKHKMLFRQQLWKLFDKSSKKQLKIWKKPLEKRVSVKILSVKSSSGNAESCSRVVIYLLTRNYEVPSQVSKTLRELIFFQKNLRLYLESCRALFWQQGRKQDGRGREIYIHIQQSLTNCKMFRRKNWTKSFIV